MIFNTTRREFSIKKTSKQPATAVNPLQQENSHPCNHCHPFPYDSCSSLILHGFLASTERERREIEIHSLVKRLEDDIDELSFDVLSPLPPQPALNFCSMAFLNFPGLFYSAFNDACKIISGFVCLFAYTPIAKHAEGK